MDIISRVQGVITKPKEEWKAIKAESMTISQIFMSYAVILAAIPAVAQFIGMALIGRRIPFIGWYRYNIGTALLYALLSYIFSLVAVYVFGIIINALAPTFSSKSDATMAMKLAVFSMTPYWVAGILYLIPYLGILAVAVVTNPFIFEQAKRMRSAEQGLKSLSEHVDSLIVIPNEKLIQVLGGKTKLTDAFVAANDVLHSAVSGIAEIISNPGLINVDFADVKTVMSEVGMAMMGSAEAVGENRAAEAAKAAVASPLLENVDLKGARGVLVTITANDSLTLEEYYEVMNTIQGVAAEEATVIVGTSLDETLEDGLRVTMVATGLGNPVRAQQKKPEITLVQPPVYHQATGTNDAVPMAGFEDNYDAPTIMRNRRSHQAAVEVAQSAGIDTLDIPAFLRKQAD